MLTQKFKSNLFNTDSNSPSSILFIFQVFHRLSVPLQPRFIFWESLFSYGYLSRSICVAVQHRTRTSDNTAGRKFLQVAMFSRESEASSISASPEASSRSLAWDILWEKSRRRDSQLEYSSNLYKHLLSTHQLFADQYTVQITNHSLLLQHN